MTIIIIRIRRLSTTRFLDVRASQLENESFNFKAKSGKKEIPQMKKPLEDWRWRLYYTTNTKGWKAFNVVKLDLPTGQRATQDAYYVRRGTGDPSEPLYKMVTSLFQATLIMPINKREALRMRSSRRNSLDILISVVYIY